MNKNKRHNTTANGSPRRGPSFMEWKRFTIGYFDSSIMELPVVTRHVFDCMIRKANWNGFVPGTEETLRRLFNVPLKELVEAIRVLESPDPKSRTPVKEGRRIEKVQGGWNIINFQLHQQVPEPILFSFNNGTGDKKREVKAQGQGQGEGEEHRAVALLGQADPSPELSPAELEIYSDLAGRIRSLFLILREWASIAADKNEPDFGVSQEHLVKVLQCRRQSVAGTLERLVRLGVIENTAPYDRPGHRSARYRWTLETTIPVPAMAEPEQKSDLDDEEDPF
jgi:hypothetical protein